MRGRIIKAVSGFYYVETDNGVFECKARGKFRNDKTLLFVGDKVSISVGGESGTVESVEERKNMLTRPPIANIDKLFIVSASVTPSPNPLLIDRIISICEYKNIEPVLVFNKTDLADVDEFKRLYQNAGFKAITCSAKTKEGIDEIKKELIGCVSAFTGNSGAGKSSILNSIFSSLNLSTAEISEKLGRGRHTTRHTELFPHKFGGYVADTPGFSLIDNEKDDLEFRDLLPTLFRDFDKHRESCKFHDCKHIAEKGCSIIEAVARGEIEKSRYESYVTIYNELKDIKPWQIKKASKF